MGIRSSLQVLMVLGISLVAVPAANAGEMYVTPSVNYIDDDPKRAADDGMSISGSNAILPDTPEY